jgi:uncharacterized membrane protein
MLAHLRNKLTAGVLTAAPLVVIVVAAMWLETNTRPPAQAVGLDWPGLGVPAAPAGVYLLGVFVTSVIGGFLPGALDKLLEHIPGLKLIYRAGKDVLANPPDKAGTFHSGRERPRAEPASRPARPSALSPGMRRGAWRAPGSMAA